MPREEIIGLHLFALDAERRRSEYMPLDLSHHVEFVTHVRWIRIGSDFVDRRRPHRADREGMGRLVQDLATFVGECGFAYGFGG